MKTAAVVAVCLELSKAFDTHISQLSINHKFEINFRANKNMDRGTKDFAFKRHFDSRVIFRYGNNKKLENNKQINNYM